jgi:glycosyltransferase involved in cell wall biosynthesis
MVRRARAGQLSLCPHLGMHLALINPTYWPEVRRGSERLIHDLAVVLARRGNDVTILTTHSGAGTETVEDGVRIVRSRRLPRLPRSGDLEYFVETAPSVVAGLTRGYYDLAHAFFPVSAWAAINAKRLGGPPVAFSLHGVPVRQYLVARRRRMSILSAAVHGAEGVSVLSEAAAEPYRRYLLREPTILPGGVFCSDFEVEVSRADRPTVVCAASLSDPRKGWRLLLEAFGMVRRRIPDARLLLAGGRDPFFGSVSLEAAAGVELIEGDDKSALAAAYASAWVSVLPAIGEAFGLVLIESLAAGTPAVALRSGASPEVLSDEVGSLVEPGAGAEGLAKVLVEALREPPGRAVADACRRRAREFDWERVADLYDDFHRGILGGKLTQ